MTTGSALDRTDTRLVRKGRRVAMGLRVGVVIKANGLRAFVKWADTGAVSYEWCNQLEVIQ